MFFGRSLLSNILIDCYWSLFKESTLNVTEVYQYLQKSKLAVIATPTISIKFIILPTPKYLRSKNNIIAEAAINPFLVLSNNIDAENKIAVKSTIKKINTVPEAWGSVKYIIPTSIIHKAIVIINAGQKLFLFRICLLEL